MPADLQQLKRKTQTVEIDCGDGQSFSVVLKPRAYSFDESLTWQDKITAAKDNGEFGTASVNVMLEWAGGIIDGIDGLMDGDRALTKDDLRSLPPDVFGWIFEKVTEAISVKKTSLTP